MRDLAGAKRSILLYLVLGFLFSIIELSDSIAEKSSLYLMRQNNITLPLLLISLDVNLSRARDVLSFT